MKTEYVKNRTVCSNLDFDQIYVTPKIRKKQNNMGNFYINKVETFQEFIMFQQIGSILLLGAKVSVFSHNQINYLPNHPKGVTWHIH